MLSLSVHSFILISIFFLSDASNNLMKIELLDNKEKCAVHDSVSTVLEDLISQLEQLVLNQKKVANELNEIISDQKELNKGEERLEKMLHGKHHTRHCVGKDTGIHEIVIPSFSKLPFQVVCDAHTRGGNWTIILRRLDGSVDFYRKWADYKAGFGNLNGEFFLGLEKINALTNDKPQELFFLLEDYEGETRYEQYDAFAIGDELDFYQLHTLGKPHGTAEDSFTYHVGSYFSSQDRDHDQSTDNCAVLSTGGWWYKDCHNSNLMGRYGNKDKGKGINWFGWHGYQYSLKRADMMIRPKT